ncbi:MAG TPA: hypothetical protein VGQ83_00840 [Polyangia bacterium]|jgi:hypothetical protein
MSPDALPFICAACGHRAAAPGDCPRCPENPLLDLRKPEVLEILEDIDSRLRRRRDQQCVWLGVGISIPLVLALAAIPAFRLVMTLIRMNHWIGYLALITLTAFGISRLALKLFPAPRRCPPA